MAFFHQPQARQPILRIPGVVLVLVLLFVAIEAWREFMIGPNAGELFYRFALVPARYSHAYLTQHLVNGGNLLERAVPFVSYMFLHASWNHVVVNSVWLLPFGSVVARRYGTLLFLCFFLLCGIAGAVVHLALNWGSVSPVIGASAAISGLMGASFRMLPTGRGAALQPLLSAAVILSSVVWIGVNVVAVITRFGTGPGVHMVAWEAHLGGYFAGLLLAGPFDAFRRSASRLEESERRLR